LVAALPNGVQAGGANEAVAADDGNTEINSGGGNDAVWKIWDF